MRHFQFIALFVLSAIFVSPQSAWGQTDDKVQNPTDSVTELDPALVDYMVAKTMYEFVDSLKNEGLYMQALQTADNFINYWKNVAMKPVPIRVYMSKVLVLMKLEEWDSMIKTCDESITAQEKAADVLDGWMLPDVYEAKASACKHSGKYKDAIIAYENALPVFTRENKSYRICSILTELGECYDKLGKQVLASSFYEKGLNKYLECFGVSRARLLKERYDVKDPRLKSEFELFAMFLYKMAVREQDQEDRSASREYLLMSAHCGFDLAIREYKRIYGE